MSLARETVAARCVTSSIAAHGETFRGVAPDAKNPEEYVLYLGQGFQPEEIRVKAGQPFVLVVTNKDAKPEEFESKDLRIEKVIPAGKTASIRVRALKPGTYPFFGEFNPKTAQGHIVAE